jgi:Zn-dependent M28 family amino/carboxypeptidase
VAPLFLLIACALSAFGCDRAEEPDPPQEIQTQTPQPPAPAPSAADPTAIAASEITTDYLRDRIREFSADEFEGRGPATPGDMKARQYLIDELTRLGYQPGAPSGWEQSVDMIGVTADMPQQWIFERDGQSLALNGWDEYIGASGVQSERAAIKNAEVVFAGYGIQAPEYRWDDFKGRDLKGKVLLMLNNDPDWDPALFQGETRLYYGRWSYKYESAARQGAAGAIIIHTTPSAGYPFQVVQTSWSGEQFDLPARDEPRIQVQAWVTEEAARKLLNLAGQDLAALTEAARSRDFQPVSLGVTTSLSFANKLNHTSSANVLGLLPGSDPALKDQVVIYTAHHDHLGVGPPDAGGDRIFNGALDNGAGVAQVLAVAKAFKALPEPPRRSILIAFVAAEEQGLLGSEYYATHPTFAPGKIAANVNLDDNGNVWGRTRDVTFIGKGKSGLDAIVDEIAARQGRVVKPDQFPDRGYYYRSDQFNFAKIGVPALYLDEGIDVIGKPPGWGREQKEDFEAHRYHQPSDEFDPDWNLEGMVEDTQLAFLAGLTIANADEMPSWNPGDEFEAARKAALEAAK